MPILPPRKPRPPLPQPTPEEADFLLWLASRQRPPRYDRSRFPYAPGPARRYPWSPGGTNPWPDENAGEPQQPPPAAPAANPPAPLPSDPPEYTQAYRGILNESPGLLGHWLATGGASFSGGSPPATGMLQQPMPPDAAPLGAGWPALRSLLGLPPVQPPVPPSVPPGPRNPSPWAISEAPPAPATPPPLAAPRPGLPGAQAAQAGAPAPNTNSIPAPRPKPPAPPVYDIYAGVPEYKRNYLQSNDQGRNWVDFIQATGYLPQVSAAEKMIYREIYAAEGANMPNGETVAGITSGTLRDFRDKIPGVTESTRPADLSPLQQAQFYRGYLGHALNLAGGWASFEDLNDPGAVRYLADTLFREGRTGGAELIQKAINRSSGQRLVAESGPVGAETLGALHNILENSNARRGLLEQLYFLRDKKRPDEWQRNQYFYQRAFE